MMENKSGLRPLGRAVLVKPYEVKTGVIELPDSVRFNAMMLDQRVEVVEIGAACWPDEPPRAKPGDRVFVSKLAGYMAQGPADGEQYRVVNDRDIFLQVTVEVDDE
jgi:co-chaperonin GroES (HSP10)